MAAFAVQAPSAYSNAYLRNITCGALGIGLSKSHFGRWPSNGAKRTALPSVGFKLTEMEEQRCTSGETRYSRMIDRTVPAEVQNDVACARAALAVVSDEVQVA